MELGRSCLFAYTRIRDRVSKFFRDQQTVYFIASHANSIFIVAVDDENDGVTAVEVVPPEHANAVLSSCIPTVRWISNQHEQTSSIMPTT